MVRLTLVPAAAYTFNGTLIADAIPDRTRLADYVAHLLANGYTDARPVTYLDEPGMEKIAPCEIGAHDAEVIVQLYDGILTCRDCADAIGMPLLSPA